MSRGLPNPLPNGFGNSIQKLGGGITELKWFWDKFWIFLRVMATHIYIYLFIFPFSICIYIDVEQYALHNL